MLKYKLRKKVLKIRKKVNNKNTISIDFIKVLRLIKNNNFPIRSVGGYFPVNYEVDDLKMLKKFSKKKISNFIAGN